MNFHTEEVMLDKITEKRRWRPMSPRLLKEKCCVIGGETRVASGYVKPKHEFNYQQAVERLPVKIHLN